MNTVHRLIIPPKMSKIRQRPSFNEVRSVNMVKSERGFAQRSLLYCIEKGCFSLVHYLLQTNASDARERDSEGRTALMYCCFIDHDGWAQNLAVVLLEYGAKIGDADRRELNALHYAIITERLILVRRYLASLDFNLNQTTDIHGNTCLHYACSTGNIGICRLVLNAMKRYSIDLTIKNRYGLTAYDIACQINNEFCQNLLRDEMIDIEGNKLPSTSSSITTNVPPLTFEPLTDRRLLTSNRSRTITPTRVRSTTPATHYSGSMIISPSTKNLRKQYSSASSFNIETAANSSSIFIDPIESRNMTLRRNESLDLSLVNQAKSLSNLGLSSSSTNRNDSFSSSSSTWRDDFSKVFDRFQTLKTPSYRETVHPPLSKEVPVDVYQNVYCMEDTFRSDYHDYHPLTIGDIAHKLINRRRSSAMSARFVNKLRK